MQQNQTIINTTPHTIIALTYNYYLNPQASLGLLYGNGQTGGWYNQYTTIGDIFTPILSLQNSWNNLVITKVINTFYVYQNGTLLGSSLITQAPSSILSQFNFGNNDQNIQVEQSFNGEIDDVRIYNRALTQSEISYLATH